MAEPVDPYAPPKAELEATDQVGTVSRQGNFVRIDSNGRLPARCIACNAPALPSRVHRTLYWSPWQWRTFLAALPLSVIAIGMSTNADVGATLTGILVIAALPLLIAHFIIRKRLEVDIGICARHRNIRRGLVAASLASMALLFAMPFLVPDPYLLSNLMLTAAGLMLALGVVYSFSAAQRLGLAKLAPRYALLRRSGRAFRESLPEATGD